MELASIKPEVVQFDLSETHKDITLNALETLSYLNRENNTYLNEIEDIKAKLQEFSSWFSCTARLNLLDINHSSDREELCYLLLTLKKNVKYALEELDRNHRKVKNQFICAACDETIAVDYQGSFWNSLQNHEHFEEIYVNRLNGSILPVPAHNMNCLETTREFNSPPSQEAETDHVDHAQIPQRDESPLNDFHFNFSVDYDEQIESKLYPESLVLSARRIDQIGVYTVQKCGRNHGVCLLCPCDLMVHSKLTRQTVVSHVTGQRHLRFANNAANVDALNKYHENWKNLEAIYQAHQIYFRPDITSTVRCMLCKNFVNYWHLSVHIESTLHRQKVMEIYESKSNMYFLIDLQVQVYGVVPKENVNEGSTIATNGKVPQRNGKKSESDSSPSSGHADSAVPVSHNISKSVENTESKNVIDLLPNRFKPHKKFLKKTGETVNCTVCKETVAQSVDAIKHHIRLAKHLLASKISCIKYRYYCDICNLRVKDETIWDDHFKKDPPKHNLIPEDRRIKVTEYECTVCKTVIYGDDLSISRHRLYVHKEKPKKDVFVFPEPLKQLFKSKEAILIRAIELTEEANAVLHNNDLHKFLCMQIGYVLSESYENCKAYPFGSRVSGLCSQFSDLDVFIDVGDMYNGYKMQDPKSQVMFVKNAAKLLNKNRNYFRQVVSIPSARTPIVKLYNPNTNLECDLSFRHGLSVENTKFLRFCLQLQPIAQPFILLLKRWSEMCVLNENISMYALAIMAIFYLQINGYLLSVTKLREINHEESLIIDGWETVNYTVPVAEMKAYVGIYPNNVVTLLMEFFQYYSTFDYEKDVICPLLGTTIPRISFLECPKGLKLPAEMATYVKKLKSEDPELFRALSPICIQDPFDLSHNLTKAASTGVLLKFKLICEMTLEHLKSIQ